MLIFSFFPNICEHKNLKERVNALNFAKELESVCFDRSYQNGAFR